MWTGETVEYTQCFAFLNTPPSNNRGTNSPPEEGCPQGGVVDEIIDHLRFSPMPPL